MLRSQPARDTPRPFTAKEVAAAAGSTLLLDEPDCGVGDHERAFLIEALEGRKRADATVLVTHDLQLARAVADDVLLVCAGTIVAGCATDRFFSSPPTELAARFVRQGNCWPAPSVPELPPHFRWLGAPPLSNAVHHRVAGMGRPGLLRDADDDLTAMALAGISVLVTLTEESFPAPLLRSFGIEGRHFPIRDMGVPGLGATAGLCRSILRSVEHGERVAIHCHAGLGRTGTILAALLIYQGVKAGDALAHVRGTCARYVQSRSQELFLHQLAESLGV